MPEETTEAWEASEKVSGDPLREWYSNEIWGKRATEDDALFEIMSLQVFQAGLTWRMVLSRRDSFRAAFADWKIDSVAAMGPAAVEILRGDSGIIRNRQKIQAVIANAGVVQGLQKEHGAFCNWFYDVLPGADYPSLQKELRSTFKFMGPEISRMWLMASGRITREEGDKYDPTG
ncbi:MAG: DNA-3-methyladenine glycosylase I [SAR202 cluster bacterium]|nr:DNA-3-methyladenine glycosylase I [SAR202 cluster bacterium]